MSPCALSKCCQRLLMPPVIDMDKSFSFLFFYTLHLIFHPFFLFIYFWFNLVFLLFFLIVFLFCVFRWPGKPSQEGTRVSRSVTHPEAWRCTEGEHFNIIPVLRRHVFFGLIGLCDSRDGIVCVDRSAFVQSVLTIWHYPSSLIPSLLYHVIPPFSVKLSPPHVTAPYLL